MKKKTYRQFADAIGSVARAAQLVGVDTSTYSRWLTGVSTPRGRAVRDRLAVLKIRIPLD